MNDRANRENLIALIKIDHIIDSITQHYRDKNGEVSESGQRYLNDIVKMFQEKTEPIHILETLRLITKVRNAINNGDPELAAEIRWRVSSAYEISEQVVNAYLAKHTAKANPAENVVPTETVVAAKKAEPVAEVKTPENIKPKSSLELNREFKRINRDDWGSDALCDRATDLIRMICQNVEKPDNMYMSLINSINEPYDRIRMIQSYALSCAGSSSVGSNPLHTAILKAFPAILAEQAEKQAQARMPETASPNAPPLPATKSPNAKPASLQGASLFKNQDAVMLEKLRAQCKEVFQSNQSTGEDYAKLIDRIEATPISTQKKVELLTAVQKSLTTRDPDNQTGLKEKVGEHIRHNMTGPTKRV